VSEVTVETSQLGTAAARLQEIADGTLSMSTRLASANWIPANAWATTAGPQIAIIGAEAALISSAVAGISEFTGGVAAHLTQAQAWYEAADAAAVAAITEVSDAIVAALVYTATTLVAQTALAAIPFLLSPAGMAITVGALAAGAGLQHAGVVPDGEDVAAWWNDNQHKLANPLTVLLVRTGVSAGDEVVNSFVGGFHAFSSPEEVAGALAAVLAVTTPSNMQVTAAKRDEPAGQVSSMADLAATIPATDANGPHASITEYVRDDGSTVHVVSVAGTSSPELGDGTNGMDNLSNLAAYAGSDTESLAAVKTAMGEAGINEGDEVVFVGYSQGALIVSQLAKSGTWNTSSVLLAGSPMHGNEIGGDVPVTQLEHDGDLITGLQGFTPQAQGDVSVVRRDPFPDGVPQGETILGPHSLTEYQQTAAGYDGVDDPQVAAQRAEALAPQPGATAVETTDFSFERLPEFGDGGGTRPTRQELVEGLRLYDRHRWPTQFR
jgi:hypothetical protein